jgi:hypothetical protein
MCESSCVCINPSVHVLNPSVHVRYVCLMSECLQQSSACSNRVLAAIILHVLCLFCICMWVFVFVCLRVCVYVCIYIYTHTCIPGIESEWRQLPSMGLVLCCNNLGFLATAIRISQPTDSRSFMRTSRAFSHSNIRACPSRRKSDGLSGGLRRCRDAVGRLESEAPNSTRTGCCWFLMTVVLRGELVSRTTGQTTAVGIFCVFEGEGAWDRYA